MGSEEQKVLEAIKVIKEYCEKLQCYGCEIQDWCVDNMRKSVEILPKYWIIEE